MNNLNMKKVLLNPYVFYTLAWLFTGKNIFTLTYLIMLGIVFIGIRIIKGIK